VNAGLTEAERDSILAGLGSPDEEVRRLSVEQLRLLPAPEAVTSLVECLGDESWRVRKAAVGRLVAYGEEAGVEERLIECLADGESPGRRNSAFETLVNLGPQRIPRLVRALSSPDVDVRKLVVDALASIGHADAREPLVRTLVDPDVNVRAAAAEALGVIGEDSEVDDLLRVATTDAEDLLVRASALGALARLGARLPVERLAAMLDRPTLRPAVLDLVGHAGGDEAVDLLLKGLSTSGPSGRAAATAALLRIFGSRDGAEADALRRRIVATGAADGSLVEWCCERLSTADLVGRMATISFLGLLGDPRAIVPILRAGRDEALGELADSTLEAMGEHAPSVLDDVWDELEVDLRCRASAVLGRVGGVVAERLLRAGLSGADPALRCESALALAAGGFFGCLPDLVRRLEQAAAEDDLEAEEEVSVIVRAIVDLASHERAGDGAFDVELAELLSHRLENATVAVRLAIAQVLARVGRAADRDLIASLLKDESPAVRRAAVLALARFEFAAVREPLTIALGDESTMVRTAAGVALGAFEGEEATRLLERLMDDEDTRVAAVAIRAFGELHGRLGESRDEIYASLVGPLSGSPIVALAGIEALTEIGGAGAAELASGALSRLEPDVVRAAVGCVGTHGDEHALAELIALVSHGDWSVRAEAIETLARRGCRKSLPGMLRRLEVEDDAFVRESLMRGMDRLGE